MRLAAPAAAFVCPIIDLTDPMAVRGFTDVPNTAFNVTLTLEINLTGQEVRYNIPPLLQPFVGTQPVIIPAGPRQLDGTIGPAGAYVVVQGTGTLQLLGRLDVAGLFRLEISSTGLTLQMAAHISIDPLGQLNISGSITVGSAGLFGSLTVTLSAGGGTFGGHQRAGLGR